MKYENIGVHTQEWGELGVSKLLNEDFTQKLFYAFCCFANRAMNVNRKS